MTESLTEPELDIIVYTMDEWRQNYPSAAVEIDRAIAELRTLREKVAKLDSALERIDHVITQAMLEDDNPTAGMFFDDTAHPAVIGAQRIADALRLRKSHVLRLYEKNKRLEEL